jgi:hypothetical protein
VVVSRRCRRLWGSAVIRGHFPNVHINYPSCTCTRLFDRGQRRRALDEDMLALNDYALIAAMALYAALMALGSPSFRANSAFSSGRSGAAEGERAAPAASDGPRAA